MGEVRSFCGWVGFWVGWGWIVRFGFDGGGMTMGRARVMAVVRRRRRVTIRRRWVRVWVRVWVRGRVRVRVRVCGRRVAVTRRRWVSSWRGRIIAISSSWRRRWWWRRVGSKGRVFFTGNTWPLSVCSLTFGGWVFELGVGFLTLGRSRVSHISFFWCLSSRG